MNREIKFRFIWRHNRSDIRYFSIEEIMEERSHIHFNDFDVNEYTWLKDKNWKEIYEGDIVKVLFDWNIAEIREWQCIIEAISWPHSYMLCNMKWEDFEIIWNLYETPLLLTN